MKIDRQIVMLASQSPDECQIGAPPPWRVRAARHNHGIEMRVVSNDRLGFFFDDVGDAGVGVVAPEGSNRGSREYDIADQPEPH